MNEITLKRFWSKVEKTQECWLWKASKRSKGYGAFVYPSDGGDIIQGRAHRFSWEIHNGPIPNDVCVLHQCDNPGCVNPNHLWLGTKAENNRDMRNKGRNVSGSKKTPPQKCKYKRGLNHHNCKINEAIVISIRKDRALGLSYSKLVKKFQLSIGNIWRIANRKAWKHVD